MTGHIFTILFMVFLHVPAGMAKTGKAVETRYIQQLEPHLARVWDESVILMAGLLLQPGEAFNQKGLKVSLEIQIGTTGRVSNASVVSSSGNEAFDDTALDAVLHLRDLPRPSDELLSDDGLVHVFWTLQRSEPFSTSKGASVRYVRFTPENAVIQNLRNGMIGPAWTRVLNTGSAGSYSKSVLVAFISEFLTRFYPPATMNPSARPFMQALLHVDAVPAEIRIPYLRTVVDENVFLGLVQRMAGKSPGSLCGIFENSLEYSEARTVHVMTMILERKESDCLARLTERGRASNWRSVKDLAEAAALRMADLDTETRDAWVARLGTSDVVSVMRIMGYSRKADFYDGINARIARESDPEIQAEAFRAMGFLPHAQVGTRLIAAMKNRNSLIKRAAIFAFQHYPSPHLDKILKVGIWELHSIVKKDTDAENRKLAAQALVSMAVRDLKNENNRHYFSLVFREKEPALLEAMIRVLPPENENARKRLIAFLSDSNPELRFAAAEQLYQLGPNPDVDPHFRGWINSSEERFRFFALRMAGSPQELITGYENLPMRSRFEVCLQMSRRDPPWLLNHLQDPMASGKPEEIFKVLPQLVGLLGNAR